ncbi:MAG: ATP-binding protein [Verrucomicrobia bacterium]|nr:ATP-binding protein [Verrucomicrobiota bacterium]
MNVLIAEDERATQARLVSYLREWGYAPVAVRDGAEAWDTFLSGDFKCVISDWMMPRMDGLELVKAIRGHENHGYVYVILLTGRTDKQNLVEGMEAGADDFLTKPFDKDELRVRLRAGRRITELEARLAERNRELSVFTSVASHDLREPLRTISGFIGLLERKYKGQLDEEADEYIQFITDGAERMRALVTDLLSYARMESRQSEFEAVNTREIVEDKLAALGAAIEECGARIICGELPTIEGDPTQLSQVFQNLIGNGIKYRGDASPVIKVGAVQRAEDWRFTVEDNGIGIPPEQATAIFEPFRRLHGAGSKYQGSGIGLAICKKVVERHGGRIWVESAPGGGSIFNFTIPKHA